MGVLGGRYYHANAFKSIESGSKVKGHVNPAIENSMKVFSLLPNSMHVLENVVKDNAQSYGHEHVGH